MDEVAFAVSDADNGLPGGAVGLFDRSAGRPGGVALDELGFPVNGPR